MRTFLVVSLAASAFIAGCGDRSASPQPGDTNAASSGGSIVTAPVDYLGAVGKAKQSAEKTVDVSSINKAVQLFQVEKGRLPRDLNELVQEKYLPYVPEPPYGTKFVYDPATGVVKAVNQ